MANTTDIQPMLKKRFSELASPVQKAILSEDIPKRLRELADTHKLHLDQWECLENEVMMALFGVSPIDELQTNIKKEVGVSDEIATALASDISKSVFEPIRAELERELEHPEAKVKEESGVQEVRTQMLSENENLPLATPVTSPQSAPVQPAPAAPPVVPATPPQAPPTAKAIRMPASGAYKPGEASTARKSIDDDPYREPPQ